MASIAVASVPPRPSEKGTHIMVAGIVFQMAAIGIFALFFCEFSRRASRERGVLEKKVQIFIGATAFSCLLIVVRSIYRTVELLQGFDGYLITHEEYFVGLNGVLMFLAVTVFNVVHPGWFLPERKEEGEFEHVDLQEEK